jgi:hypothetical protein
MKKILCRVSRSRQRGTCAESRSTWLSAKNYWGTGEAAQHHNPHGPNFAHDPASCCWMSIDKSTTHNALPPSQTLVYMCRSLSCPPPPQLTSPPPSAHLASLLPLHLRPVHTPPSRATPPAQPRHPLLHPPLAPHLVARSKGGSRRDGGLPPDATS